MPETLLEKKWIETSAGRVYYYLSGSRSGFPTIVFLHGLSSNHTTWLRAAGYLMRNGHDCLLVEMRGHGDSDKTRRKDLYRMPVFSSDLENILVKEKIENFVLVGYSFGGAIALDYAVNRSPSPRAMILISTNHVNPLRFWRIGFLASPARLVVYALARILQWEKRKNYRYYHPDKAGGYWRSVWHGFGTMPWSINLWMLAQMSVIDYSDTIERIKFPVLIMHSRKDPFLTEAEVKEMVNKMPRSSVIVSGHENHFIASQSQDEVAHIILDFVNKYENSDL